MTDRILQILDNVRYWDTCPNDYKKDIEAFLDTHKQALHKHDVVGRSERLPCGDCYNYAEYDGGIKYCSVCGTKFS